MKTICDYRELNNDDSLPSVRDHISDLPIPNKREVLQYLNAAKPRYTSFLPNRNDVFTGEEIFGGLCIYTDGVYSWTNEERYYFEKYNLELKAEFLQSLDFE